MAAVAANPAPTLEHKIKPAKPDEEAFKNDLAQAEKEHSAVQEKLVCISYVDHCVLVCIVTIDGFWLDLCWTVS